MKRDLDLIKSILLDIEAHTNPIDWIDLNYDGYTNEEISYHVKILSQAGLVEANDMGGLNYFEWKPHSLTWHGHEFLDAARNETVWNKTKEIVKEKGGSVPFAVLNDLLVKVATSIVINTG